MVTPMSKTGQWVPSLQDDINQIPGCGKITSQRLYNQGIHTYSDLLSLKKSDVAGLDLTKLQKIAEQQLRANKREISDHSWKNLTAHVIRTDGKVTRVVIKNILIGPHSTVINVVWSEGGCTRKRSLSPLVLTWVHHLWTHADIVSEDSDQESARSMEVSLPLLEFAYDSWSPSERVAAIGLLNETNRLMRYSQSLQYQNRVLPPRPNGLEVAQHSWINHSVYVLRKSKVTRARVGSIVLLPHRVQVWVYWTQNQQQRRSMVSPVALLLVLAMWFESDVISDDSESQEDEPPLKLPILSVSLAELDLLPSQVNALAFVVHEVNQISRFNE